MRRLNEMINLSDRVALVTGGGGAIGRVFCQTLAEMGAAVAIVDVRAEVCESLARKISEEYGVRALGLEADLEKELSYSGLPGRIEEEFGRLDVLVNNAAFSGDAKLLGWAVPFEEQRTAAWRRALEVNLIAVFELTRLFAPMLRASGGGSVVNIASIYGVTAPDFSLYRGTEMGNPAAYGASKGGVIQLTRYLATVLAPEVRVNVISPGGVWRNQPEKFHQRYQRRTPLCRMGTEEDFKGALAYLAGDLSEYVTGHNLIVDGGWTIW